MMGLLLTFSATAGGRSLSLGPATLLKAMEEMTCAVREQVMIQGLDLKMYIAREPVSLLSPSMTGRC